LKFLHKSDGHYIGRSCES